MLTTRSIFLKAITSSLLQRCTMKHFPPPKLYEDIILPEKPKLRFMDKVPQYPPGMRAPKMMKKLKLMMGPEEIHNTFLHEQYGIIALSGGRLKFVHFEVIRLAIGRMLDTTRMFAIWRVDAPWQSVTKKGQGQRMGGGKPAIDHYVTPIKQGRVILEVGGKMEFAEIERQLKSLARKLPFKAAAVSHEMMLEMKRKEKFEEENNQNRFPIKYVIQNNMGGCHNMLRPNDLKYFGKYV